MSPESKCLYSPEGKCVLQKWADTVNAIGRRMKTIPSKTTDIEKLFEDLHQANEVIQGSACSNCPHPSRSKTVYENLLRFKNFG